MAELEAVYLPKGVKSRFISDGYHTFDELYEFRMLYNAAFFNQLARADAIENEYNTEVPRYEVHKSWRHNDGEECFGGGWFIVVAQLPTGQITNHYKAEHWDLFKVPERDRAVKWDGHTPQDVIKRLSEYLQNETPRK